MEEQHAGLEVRDVLRGNAPVYFHAIMSAPGKEKDKERTLKTPMAELLGLEADASAGETEAYEPYVDLTMTCVLKGDAANKVVLEGVPPIRVHLRAPKIPATEKKEEEASAKKDEPAEKK